MDTIHMHEAQQDLAGQCGTSAKLSAVLRLNNALIESLIPNVRLGRIEFIVGGAEPPLLRG
jgi:hypothetical protein